MQKKIADGDAAEAVVRRKLESIYGEKLKGISFRKAWHTPIGNLGSGLWDVEGTYKYKKLLWFKGTRVFRYQIDAETGNVIGHEEITPKQGV
jgi:hypothetical protein